MSLNLEGQKCPVCHAYLFDEDEIVYCPECGAPHHKDCYLSLGHCGLAQLHGTDRQYDRVKAQAQEKPEEISPPVQLHKSAEHHRNDNTETQTVKCGMCGEEYDGQLRGCPKCGSPNVSRMGGNFAYFDFLGGVPADMNLGDNVTADEAKRFVVTNTQRYIPKFAAMTAGKKASWNWFAFLFPCGWFLSRKMYKNGILTGILTVALSLLTVPFSRALYFLDTASVKNYTQMAQLIMDNLPQIGKAALILSVVGTLLGLLMRIIVAIIGDYTYKKHAIATIKQIKHDSEDIDDDFRRKGGVSFFAMILGVIAVEYLPAVIAMFL